MLTNQLYRLSVCQPFEELCSTANTDVDNLMASELSRLRNENDLLRRNVTVLRDENDLLRDTWPAKSYQLNLRNAKLNLKFGIRLKKHAQKRKTTRN